MGAHEDEFRRRLECSRRPGRSGEAVERVYRSRFSEAPIGILTRVRYCAAALGASHLDRKLEVAVHIWADWREKKIDPDCSYTNAPDHIMHGMTAEIADPVYLALFGLSVTTLRDPRALYGRVTPPLEGDHRVADAYVFFKDQIELFNLVNLPDRGCPHPHPEWFGVGPALFDIFWLDPKFRFGAVGVERCTFS